MALTQNVLVGLVVEAEHMVIPVAEVAEVATLAVLVEGMTVATVMVVAVDPITLEVTKRIHLVQIAVMGMCGSTNNNEGKRSKHTYVKNTPPLGCLP